MGAFRFSINQDESIQSLNFIALQEVDDTVEGNVTGTVCGYVSVTVADKVTVTGIVAGNVADIVSGVFDLH